MPLNDEEQEGDWQCTHGIVTIKAGTSPITALSSRRRRLLAVSSEDCRLKIWNLETNRVIHGFLQECFEGAVVTCILWQSDTTLLVSAGRSLHRLVIPDWALDDGGVTTPTGKKSDGERRPFLSKSAHESWPDIVEDEINQIKALDATRVAMADDSGRVSLFSLTLGTCTDRFSPSLQHLHFCTSLDLYHPSSSSSTSHAAAAGGPKTLVSGGMDNTIRHWDLKSNTLLHSLDINQIVQSDPSALQLINPPYVNCLAITAEHGILFAGLGNGMLLSGRISGAGRHRGWKCRTTQAHSLAIGTLAILPTTPSPPPSLPKARPAVAAAVVVVTGGNDAFVRVWALGPEMKARAGQQLSTPRCLAEIKFDSKINAVEALEHDRVAVGDVLGNIHLLSLQFGDTRGSK